ncbi:MAG: VWA domain-containing protein [Acidobacteriaceae bacterium]|nr:VWA domain-containing protein [Acidobacteriaceae bacterium]
MKTGLISLRRFTPNPHVRKSVCSVIAAAFVLASSASFGKAAEHTEPAYTISDNVDLVLLDACVKDRQGGYVSGLTRDRFKVYEDGRLRTITHFANVDAPVTVGLVVDNSGSMRLKRREVVMAGLAFAKQSNPHDEFFVVNFNDYAYNALPRGMMFTDSIGVVRSALYLGQPMGLTALYDALALALKDLEGSHHEMRTVVLVSDGGDNVSELRFSELLDMIEASRATIYTVGLLDPFDRDNNPRLLKKLASITGGEFFAPATLNDILPAFEKISKDIRNRYTIGFAPDEASNKHPVRHVKVTAEDERGRKLRVSTRSTYRVTPLSELVARQSPTERREQHR